MANAFSLLFNEARKAGVAAVTGGTSALVFGVANLLGNGSVITGGEVFALLAGVLTAAAASAGAVFVTSNKKQVDQS